MNDFSDFKGKTVLVTGGAGCVGSNLCRRLAELEAKEVIILDDLSSAYEWNIPKANNISFVKGSILDEGMLKRVFKKRPQYVYHLAAHFANQNSVDNPEKDLLVNGLGILKVLEHAQLVDVDRFVYSSSGCGVYGLDSKMPFEEHDISISLHTPYQVTKLLGELYTNYFHNLYEMPVVNARFFNVFGPGEVPGWYRNVIPNFIYWAMNGQPLPITVPGLRTLWQPTSTLSPTIAANFLRPVSITSSPFLTHTNVLSDLTWDVIAPAPRCDLYPRMESPT